MAINIIQSTDDLVRADINNGDREALKNIVQKWGFGNEASALRFALAVLIRAENKKVYIDEGGVKSPLVPGDSLLAEGQPNDENQAQTE